MREVRVGARDADGVPFMKLEHVPDTRHREAPQNVGVKVIATG